MNRAIHRFTLAIVMLAGATCAQTAPTTRPLQDDDKNLEGALRQMYAGVFAQDHDVIRASLYAKNDPKQLLVEAQTQRVLASIRLVDALSKFGDSAIKLYEPFHVVVPSDFMILLGTNWEIRGDRATVDPDSKFHFRVPSMINVRGVWKLDITPSRPPASVEALASALTRQSRVFEQITNAVNSRELQTLDDIAKALEQAPKFAASEFRPELILSTPDPSQK
jgi:hypothetical protein